MNLTKRIESAILSNLKQPEERKIGIEVECILYNNKMQRIPVNPCDEYSATDLLNELDALQIDDDLKAGYSLEPGGQLEWASYPINSLHKLNEQYLQHLRRLLRITKREKLKIIDYALEPLYKPSDIELIENDKYRLMDKMFQKTGKLGQWMMRNSASVQINIDYSSKKEGERMAFIADCLSPLTSILFAHSPFWTGIPAGKQNLRYKVWSDTDDARSNDLMDHGIFSSEGLVHEYAKYIQIVPAIFITDDSGNILEYNGTLGEWLSQLEKDNSLTDDQIQIALHQIFTNVRFKNVLEIRGSDRPPSGFEFAPAALWIGLLLDDETQLRVYDIVSDWTLKDREQLNFCAQNLDINQIGPQNKSISEWIQIMCNLSLGGLRARSLELNIKDEVPFLEEYLEYYNETGIVALHIQKKQTDSGKTVRAFIY